MVVGIIAASPTVYLRDFKADYVIAVDNGYNHAVSYNIKVDCFVGDLDSLDVEPDISDKIILTPEKDETDLMVAAKKALALNPEKIIIYGATNARFDHYYANIHLLDMGNIEIVDEYNRIYIMDSNFAIERNDEYISFFAYEEDVLITLKGFKYPLDSYTLRYGDPLCVSNEIVDDLGEVLISNKVLVIHSK